MADTKDVNNKIQIHIVSSVKGGCGKTAFSLFKALEMANKERNDHPDSRRAGVIWIDADFNGTASRALFYGKNEAEFEVLHSDYTIRKLQEEFPSLFAASPLPTKNRLCFDSKYVPYTINDYLREDISGLEKMIVHGYVFGEQRMGIGSNAARSGCINGVIDFIFSSGVVSDKQLFNYGSGLPTIEVGRFTYLMRAMLLRICEMGRTKTKAAGNRFDTLSNYKHIIIDMPPGDDAYSSALLDMIRKLAGEKNHAIEIHLYTLTTSDRGHMYAVQQSLKDTCERLRSYKHEERIYAVLSEVRTEEFGFDSDMVTDPDQVSKALAQYTAPIIGCKEEIQKTFSAEMKNIDILFCKFQKEYYQFCRNLDEREFTYSITEVS